MSAAFWDQMARPIQIEDAQRNSLGTIKAVLRGRTEREIEGGVAMYDALLVVPLAELERQGIDNLPRFTYVIDPLSSSTFTVVATRRAVRKQATLIKCELEGIQ